MWMHRDPGLGLLLNYPSSKCSIYPSGDPDQPAAFLEDALEDGACSMEIY
jgi:hypothetical protein